MQTTLITRNLFTWMELPGAVIKFLERFVEKRISNRELWSWTYYPILEVPI